MAIFKEFKDGDNLRLSLVKNERDHPKTGTHFTIRTSLLHPGDTHVSIRPQNFPAKLHEDVDHNASGGIGLYSLKSVIPTRGVDTFPLLGRLIISGSAKWDSSTLKLPGEFIFTPGYWEWAEDILSRYGSSLKNFSFYKPIYASLYTYGGDSNILQAFCESWCPTTNTLHTLAGEFSISLWDLHRLGGLPIVGEIYDEAVPNLHIINQRDQKGRRLLSPAYDSLLLAYHHIVSDPTSRGGVTAKQWINFWCKRSKVYTIPLKRKRTATSQPKSTYNPTGEIKDRPKSWTTEEEGVFQLLSIDGDARKELVYLAAFLSCWLCVFVLPQSEDRLIRPGTFEVAIRMAQGNEYSLAIPVLCSIYRGLNVISTASKPARSKCYFPAHFLYSWLARYFRTHHEARNIPPGPMMVTYSGLYGAKYFDGIEARKLIHEGLSARVGCTILNKNKDELLLDDGNLDSSDLSYLIALRSGYLVLRHRDSFHVEPYVPSRFCRQFGYCQDKEGVLARSVGHREVSYDNALKYWRLFLFIGSQSRVLTPRYSLNWPQLVYPRFRAWWSSVTVTDLREHAHVLPFGTEVDTTLSKKPAKPDNGANAFQPQPDNLYKRTLPPDEGDGSINEARSEVNFKHKGKRRNTDHLSNVDDFLRDVPSSDTPVNPLLV